MNGLLIGIIMNILAMFNDVESTDKKTTVCNDDKSTKANTLDSNENRYANKKLKHYYAEEVFCSLADTLWDVKAHDEVLNAFKNTDVKLTGTVNRVRNNIDGCYVVFTQKRADGLKDGWAVITCYFDDEDQIEKVMKLKKGDIITITGHGSKYPLTGLSLYDCYYK